MTVLRRLTSADAAAYREIRLRAVKAHPEAFYGDWEEENRLSLEEFAKRLENSVTYGVFIDETLAAIAGYYWISTPKLSHKCKFVGVYVSPEYRGRGFMKQLLNRLLEEAKKRFEFAFISAEENNKAAIDLYHSLGFETYAVEKNCMKIGDRYCHDELMVKRLK